IAAAYSHSLALKRDGTVVAWGCSRAAYDDGQCSVPSSLSGVTAVAAGTFQSLALKRGGTVVAWGCHGGGADFGQCDVPSRLCGVTVIAAASDQSLALATACQTARAPCTVPKVVGRQIAFAKLTIKRNHCRTETVRFAYSRLTNQGTVISQSRRPGQVLPTNSKINLVVSRGRK